MTKKIKRGGKQPQEKQGKQSSFDSPKKITNPEKEGPRGGIPETVYVKLSPEDISSRDDLRESFVRSSKKIDKEGEFIERKGILLGQVKDYLTKAKSKFKSVGERINELEAQGYEVKNVKGDGNCLFHAIVHNFEVDGEIFNQFLNILDDQFPQLAKQLRRGTQNDVHKILRKMVVKYMRDHPEDFRPFMEDNVTLEKYLAKMARSGTWGGHQELVALANILHINIHAFGQGIREVIAPNNLAEGEVLANIRVFHHGNHYQAVDVVNQERLAAHEREVSLVRNDETSIPKEIIDVDKVDSRSTKKSFIKFTTEESKEITQAIKELFEGDYHLENVKGDGNCLFRVVSKLLPDLHYNELRQIAAEYLNSHRNDFIKMVPKKEMNDQIEKIKTPGEWAGAVAFQALADALGVNFYIVGAYTYNVLSRTNTLTDTNLFVLFDGSHYQAIIPNIEAVLTTESNDDKGVQGSDGEDVEESNPFKKPKILSEDEESNPFEKVKILSEDEQQLADLLSKFDSSQHQLIIDDFYYMEQLDNSANISLLIGAAFCIASWLIS